MDKTFHNVLHTPESVRELMELRTWLVCIAPDCLKTGRMPEDLVEFGGPNFQETLGQLKRGVDYVFKGDRREVVRSDLLEKLDRTRAQYEAGDEVAAELTMLEFEEYIQDLRRPRRPRE